MSGITAKDDKGAMKKYYIFLEILFYVVVPYLIWTNGREGLGDYWALLLSTAPGFAYTIVRFIVDREFNVTGIFILFSLLVGTVIDILSGSAERMLWNQVYLGVAFSFVYLVSMLVKKPLPLFFFIDVAFLQGYDRESSRKLFYRKELFKWFQLLTLMFVIRGLTLAGIKAWLLDRYGVDSYGTMLIYLRITGWVFAAVFIWFYLNIYKEIKRLTQPQPLQAITKENP